MKKMEKPAARASKKPRQRKILIFIVCLAISYSAAIIGSLFTSSSVNSSWYEQIRPAITPPGWIFPIVWNILFFMIALAMHFAWLNKKTSEDKKNIIAFFGLNLLFNILWSFFFFFLKSPFLGMLDIALVWLSIIFAISICWKISKPAAYLLIPYFLWVSFASYLNFLMV